MATALAVRPGRQAIDHFFELSLFLLVATGFVTVAATGKLDVPSVLLVSAALAVRSLAFLGFSKVTLSPRTVTRLTVGYFVFYALDYILLSRSFVDATGHLVFFVMIVKLFSARANRDFLYLALLGFMEMLLAAILTIGTAFIGFFLVFLLFGIATFTSYEMRRAYERAAHPAEVPGGPVVRGLGATAIVVSLSILVLGGAIFFIIPRFTTGYLSRFAPKTQHFGGFSDNVELGEIGDIKRSTAVVMRVRFHDDPPQIRQLRWRGVALTLFDGRRWFNPNHGNRVLPGNSMAVNLSDLEESAPSGGFRYRLRGMAPHGSSAKQDLRYTVLLEPLSSEHLFVIPAPAEISGRFRMIELDANDALLLRDRAFAAMRYDVRESHVPVLDMKLVRTDAKIPGRIGELPAENYLRLPRLDPRIAELARQVSEKGESAYDRARLIEEHLKTKFGYTLEMPFTGDDPIAGFLFEQKRGHCEYFSSAMAVMVRTLGIPSRIVNGFLPGEYNDISSLYMVRAADAHSWVEAYFPSYGWVSFDPTPAAGAIGSAGIGRLRMYLDALQSFWIDWVIHYDFTRQFMLFRNMDRTSRQATTQTRDYFRGRYRELGAKIRALHARLKAHPAALPAMIALLGITMAGVLGAGSMTGFLRRTSSEARARAGRSTARDATLAYQRLLELLARRGYTKAPAMSAREFLPQIKDPVLAPLTGQFTALYEHARFGNAADLVPQLHGLLSAVAGASSRESKAAASRRTPYRMLK